jgi:DNA-binding protein YbaB
VGLFKGMKDLSSLTKQAKQMQRQQQEEAGYKPGMRGSFQQMGDMIGQANEMLADIGDSQGERAQILANGISGQGVIVAHGTPERGAQWFNLDIDMEIHVSGRQPYRVNNMYMVPAGATLGQGVTLPVKVDPNDPSKIAIDWESAQRAPQRGEVRTVGGSGFSPAPAATPAPAPSGGAGGGDQIAELERLAKLRDSGALTDAEFEQQKAKILSS